MAFENTEPKNGLIIQIAIFSIVAFVAVRFGVVSLYHQTVDAEYDRKIANAGRQQITAARADAEQKLAGFDKAAAAYAKSGRSGSIAPASTPCESVDNDPAKGWSHLPTGFVAKPCPTPDAGVEGDAGVDADAAVSADAGAPPPAPKN
jgi:hypothetical protein